ncbi:uncharacterized protein BDZ99DRAFT_476542 [Mytilinidion resinicola]|uniref:F-box domain-containing protein n=1 Tax=Mytilinidion resinicola TaxID=574789 RepID=A0A6A6YNQ7_9PEZI|nr:uncharacterized protein BDZ99DRAFT_476542 [Mytilinidion resinicola]KAF2810371.1 hypothetical protein BDZ99DRAFT_476542 [Mytilinidion resinicola]
MESIIDLLQLPTASEAQGSYYNHPTGRIEEAVRMLRTYDHERIGRLDLQLKENSQTLAKFAKGANQGIRILRAQAERRRLEARHQLLVSGWEQIKANLQPASLMLLALPLEIRDQIYSHLYTRSEVIHIQYPDSNTLNGRMLPGDAYFYMNAAVVAPQIALEAAKVFYHSNSFSLETPNAEHISRFLSTDHYGSSVQPASILRRIAIDLKDVRHYSSGYDTPTGPEPPGEFEKELRQDMAIRPTAYNHRHLEAPLLAMPELCVLDVSIEKSSEGHLRPLAPLFKKLRRRGVRVRVILKWKQYRRPSYELFEVPGRVILKEREWEEKDESPNSVSDDDDAWVDNAAIPKECADISRLFDNPTDKDWELVREHGERLKRGQEVAKDDMKLWFAKGRIVYEEQLDVCEWLDEMERVARAVETSGESEDVSRPTDTLEDAQFDELKSALGGTVSQRGTP